MCEVQEDIIAVSFQPSAVSRGSMMPDYLFKCGTQKLRAES